MAGGDEGLWRTLVLIYATAFASAVCIPCATVVPVVFGIDSLAVIFVFGCLGLGLTGLVVAVITAQFDALTARVAEETARVTEEAPIPSEGRQGQST